ncbi:MAG: cytochrome P450 [Myxococcota bacterium]
MKSVANADLKSALHARGPAAWRDIVDANGRTFRLGPFVATADPRVVHEVLMGREHIRERPVVYKLLSRWMPGQRGMVFVDGEAWKKQARALLPVFSRPHVHAISSRVARVVDDHVGRWCQQGTLTDARESCIQLGADLFVSLAFGLVPGGSGGAELIGALRRWLDTQHDPRFRFDDPHIRAGQALTQLPGLVLRSLRTFRDYQAQRRALVPDGTPPDDSWLGRLGGALASPDADSAISHLFWAYDALPFVVSCALLRLGRHPELLPVLHGDVTRGPERAWDIPRVRAFVREVLRCHPVTMAVARRTGAPVDVEGERLPAGTELLLLVHALHHDPASWRHPDEFQPERWLRGDVVVEGAFIPFLVGPRKCVGQTLAELVLSEVVASVVRRARVHARDEDPPLHIFLAPRFRNALPLTFEAVP